MCLAIILKLETTHKDKVPEEWIRKQTLVNAERYITEELKEYEAKILGAEDTDFKLLNNNCFLNWWELDESVYKIGTTKCLFNWSVRLSYVVLHN